MFDEDELVSIMQRAGHFSQLSTGEVRDRTGRPTAASRLW